MKRGNPYPHKYKHGKRTKTIDFETFMEGIEGGKFSQPLRDRSYLVFLFWSGIRRSEAYEAVKENFTVRDNVLLCDIPAKKKGERGGHLRIPIDLPYVNLVVKRVELAHLSWHPELKTRRNWVWPISDTTAWRIVKRVFPNLYPHFFRLNRAVLFCQNPETSDVDLKSWFGWRSSKSIDYYMGVSERSMIRMGKRLKPE